MPRKPREDTIQQNVLSIIKHWHSWHINRIMIVAELRGFHYSYKQVRNALFRMRKSPYYKAPIHMGLGWYQWT